MKKKKWKLKMTRRQVLESRYDRRCGNDAAVEIQGLQRSSLRQYPVVRWIPLMFPSTRRRC